MLGIVVRNPFFGLLTYWSVPPVRKQFIQFDFVKFPQREILVSSLNNLRPPNVVLGRACKPIAISSFSRFFNVSAVRLDCCVECPGFDLTRILWYTPFELVSQLGIKSGSGGASDFINCFRNCFGDTSVNPIL